MFIERAGFYANTIWLGRLLKLEKFELFINWKKLCENVIKSDNGDACIMVTNHMKKKTIKFKLSYDLKECALEKGIKKILKAFDLSEEESKKRIGRKPSEIDCIGVVSPQCVSSIVF